jgi:hypothetical protein
LGVKERNAQLQLLKSKENEKLLKQRVFEFIQIGCNICEKDKNMVR